jgi:hypothetical protein
VLVIPPDYNHPLHAASLYVESVKYAPDEQRTVQEISATSVSTAASPRFFTG